MTARPPAAARTRSAAFLAVVAVAAFGLAGTASGQNPPLRLLVWINSDKGYNGLQNVGDAFAALSVLAPTEN